MKDSFQISEPCFISIKFFIKSVVIVIAGMSRKRNTQHVRADVHTDPVVALLRQALTAQPRTTTATMQAIKSLTETVINVVTVIIN